MKKLGIEAKLWLVVALMVGLAILAGNVFGQIDITKRTVALDTLESRTGHFVIRGIPKLTDSLGIGNSAPLSPIHYGNNVTVPDVSLTQEMGIMVRTNYVDGPTTNPHSFVDASVFDRDGYSLNSYDASCTISAIGNGHYDAFKAIGYFTGAGTLNTYYGFYTGMKINVGTTVTNVYGHYVALATGGTGTVTNNYGYYCSDLNVGTNRWAFYSAGTVPSLFGGAFTVNGNTTFGDAATDITTINGVLRLTPRADPPGSPTLGDIYVDTDTHIYFYNGTSWIQLDN